MEKTKVIGVWVRVSTDMQGDSPEHHRKRAEYYCQAKGWEIRTIYQLEAVSGKSVMDVPEFKQMLVDIKKGYITGLVFSKLARVARNTKELIELADYFKEHNADLISLEEAIDTSTPAGRFFYTLIAAMGQWEREEISARVAASISIRAKLGKSTGGAASYGYKWEANKLVLDEAEAPVRKLMFELFAQTKRKKATARALNDRGYRTREGGLFSDTTIDRLLRDPTAKGMRRANYTKSRGQKKHWDYKPSSDWVLIECPAIVSEELWNECNQYLDLQRKTRNKPGRRTDFLLAGYIRCHCGDKMYVYHEAPTYACKKCKNRIAVTDIDEIYHAQLKDFLFTESDIAAFRQQAEVVIQEKNKLSAVAKAEAQKLEAEMRELVAMRVQKELTPDDFTHFYQPLKARFAELEETIAETQGEVDFFTMQALSSETVLEESRDLYARWPELPFDDKRSIVETITEQIIIEPQDIIIKLAYLPSHTLLQNAGKRQHNSRGS